MSEDRSRKLRRLATPQAYWEPAGAELSLEKVEELRAIVVERVDLSREAEAILFDEAQSAVSLFFAAKARNGASDGKNEFRESLLREADALRQIASLAQKLKAAWRGLERQTKSAVLSSIAKEPDYHRMRHQTGVRDTCGPEHHILAKRLGAERAERLKEALGGATPDLFHIGQAASAQAAVIRAERLPNALAQKLCVEALGRIWTRFTGEAPTYSGDESNRSAFHRFVEAAVSPESVGTAVRKLCEKPNAQKPKEKKLRKQNDSLVRKSAKKRKSSH